MKISEKIKFLRISHDMTQLDFAKIAGVSDKAVSTWEKGIKEPRMSSLAKICAHFNLDLNSFADENIDETPLTAVAFELSPGEDKLLSFYRDLNAEGQEKLLDYASDLAATGNYKKSNQLRLADKQA